MTKGNLREAISDHIESKSLSKHQLESLIDLKESGVGKSTSIHTGLYRIASLMVFLCLSVAGTIYFVSSHDSLEDKIGNEVAKNHIKLKPLEIETSKIQAIRDYFTQLEFVPVESKIIRLDNKSLLGGRYCSIQGVTAAQLRLKDNKTGDIQSLYQTVYKPDVFKGLPKLEEGEKPITIYSKGLEVDIWVEKGIVFALTREPDNE